MGKNKGIVMDGRIGTVVFPDAELKYMSASAATSTKAL
jgi:cytidylate kinase